MKTTTTTGTNGKPVTISSPTDAIGDEPGDGNPEHEVLYGHGQAECLSADTQRIRYRC